MIKVVSLFKRKKGMSVEDFQSYWLGKHAKIVCKMPGVRRYVQSHTLLSGYARRSPPAVDGVAELWFDNTDALRALAGHPTLKNTRADHDEFMEISTYLEIITEDVVIKAGDIPVDGVKNIELVTRKMAMAPAAFHRYWVDVHGPLGGSIPQVHRYVQSHTRLAAYKGENAPALDGVALTWFRSTDEMRAAALTEQYARTRADEDNFLTIPLDFVITNEHVIVS